MTSVRIFFNRPRTYKHSSQSFSQDQIQGEIVKPKDKAQRPNRVPNYAMKKLLPTKILQLTVVYNASFRLRYFTIPWKIASIILTLKSNSISYRPISLLNSFKKNPQATYSVTNQSTFRTQQFPEPRLLRISKVPLHHTTAKLNHRLQSQHSNCCYISELRETLRHHASECFGIHAKIVKLPVRFIQILYGYLPTKTFTSEPTTQYPQIFKPGRRSLRFCSKSSPLFPLYK